MTEVSQPDDEAQERLPDAGETQYDPVDPDVAPDADEQGDDLADEVRENLTPDDITPPENAHPDEVDQPDPRDDPEHQPETSE
jgi:hypothetical protein